MTVRLSGLALLVLTLAAGPAFAQTTIRVPADQPTIQAGIDAAVPGDTVLVAPGTYVERINFAGKAITVASASGPTVTVIDGNRGGTVVTFSSGEGRAAVLRGFTVTNGGGFSGGGIGVSNASPTIESNVITRNTGCDGIGINVSFGSPYIVKNEISRNVRSGCSGGVGGAGIKVGGASAALIEDNVIADNSLTGGSGGGISLFAAGAPVLRNNVIVRNTVSGVSPAAQGGGIWIVNQSDALIVQNLIAGNSAGEGGGVYWLVPSGARGPRLVNNTIADNLATVAGRGSAVFADGFDVNASLVNNVLVAPAGQTALYCGNFNDPNPPSVRFNDVFAGNAVAYGGICTDQSGVNGNRSADPMFVAPANGDYRLQAGSVAMDAGDSTAADVPATDLDGEPRVVDGDSDGVVVVDMGAWERPRGTIHRIVDADSMLTPGSKNLNEGAHSLLVVDTHRTVVGFSLAGLSAAGISRVTLRLTLAEAASGWGSAGRDVSVYRLAVSFTEGNGKSLDLSPGARDRGNGPGVTWSCATDSEIGNGATNCATQWNGGAAAAAPSASAAALHTNGQTGTVEWDVTDDVVSALSEGAPSVQWLLRRAIENQTGRAAYHSAEGAAALGDADLAPTMTIEF